MKGKSTFLNVIHKLEKSGKISEAVERQLSLTLKRLFHALSVKNRKQARYQYHKFCDQIAEVLKKASDSD